MKEDNRAFTGVFIPREIYLDKVLTWTEKIILAEIHSFTARGNDCFISNEHIADFAKISIRQVQRCLANLINSGWVAETMFDGRKRYLRSTMCVIADVTSMSHQIRHPRQGSDDVNVTHTVPSTLPSTEEVNIPFIEFWNLYNKKVGDRTKCEKKWNKFSAADRDKIMATLPAFLKQFSDKQYQPFPATYLNQRRWEDEIQAPKGNGRIDIDQIQH